MRRRLLDTKLLFDTSTIIDLERAPKRFQEPWAGRTLLFADQFFSSGGQITICYATLFELFNGALKNGPPERITGFKANVLLAWSVDYPDAHQIELSARIFAALDSVGNRIGLLDSMIAASAIQNGLTLVTSNTAHFERVQAAGFELKMQNWRQS